jgi:GDP-L-fucose synthase
MEKDARIFVAGHRGLVGSAILQELRRQGFTYAFGRTRAELDLIDQQAVEHFFDKERPDYVFLAAARVGGIKANSTYPATFLYENLQIQNNVLTCAAKTGVKKLLFLGSSCIYPRMAPQPLKEAYLLSGPLELTNEWYAIAKIAGIKLCQAYRRQFGCDFISAMPTNMFGPNDNFDLDSSHVIPALIRKFHEAKQQNATFVTCWGSGTPRREFLYSEDLARACAFLMENYSEEQFINVGFGSDVTIKELAELIRSVVGFEGEVQWDLSKPDGTPRKLMDSSRLVAMGWKARVELRDGLERTYQAFLRGEMAQRSAA